MIIESDRSIALRAAHAMIAYEEYLIANDSKSTGPDWRKHPPYKGVSGVEIIERAAPGPDWLRRSPMIAERRAMLRDAQVPRTVRQMSLFGDAA